MKLLLLSAAGLTTILSSPIQAQTAGSYTIIDVGDLGVPGGPEYTNATGMNELGHVAVVTSDGFDYVPALYRDGQLIDLGGFPGVDLGGGSKGVNNLDQVCGWSMMPLPVIGTQSEPFLWTEGEGMLNPIDDEPENWSGEAWDVNDAGQMAIRSMGGFYDPVAGLTRPSFPDGGAPWAAWDLNEDGVLAGAAYGPEGPINAYRYVSATDTIVNLNDQDVDHHSEAYGINDLGDVAGWSVQHDLERPAMIWKADGEALRFPSGDLHVDLIDGTAEHVNNHGDVVGIDRFPGPTGGNPELTPIGWVAFDAVDGPGIHKRRLLDLLDPAQAQQWTQLHPFEINDRGEICGIAVPSGPDAVARGFLMVPTAPDHFRNLSRALAGSDGHPVLLGKGRLEPNERFGLQLRKAVPGAPGFLMMGRGTAYAPFRGGVMVPDLTTPGAAMISIVTDEQGHYDLSRRWPASAPAGLEIVFQCWLRDPMAAGGVSASNAVRQQTL